jgi:hypothetical protein
MTANCTNCDSTFRGADRNEDGSPYLETTPCPHPGCEVCLCQAGCEHLSFNCDACGQRFCAEHKVVFDALRYCLGCAVEAVECPEPECQCSQTDVDMFDPCGCEVHDGNSPWNVRLRALKAVQQYERKIA